MVSEESAEAKRLPSLTTRHLSASPRPEAELLRACARTCIAPATATRIAALLTAGIDWTDLIETARRHRMLPLLYQNLLTTCPQLVPPAVIEHLQSTFQATARHNMLLTGELLKLLHLLETHAIRAIPFKGPVLAALVYGNLSLRPFSDLDILVRPDDLLPARDLLNAHGYQVSSSCAASAKVLPLRRRYDCQLRGRDGRITVELQCGIFRWPIHYPPDFELLWQRFEFVPLAGQQVRNFLPEELLLNLCVHGAKHRWNRFIWICDIAEVLRRYPNLDWNYLTDQACRMGARRMLWLGLLLAHTLLDATLPEAIVQHIQTDSATLSLANQAGQRLFRADEHIPPTEDDAPLFYLRMRERWWDKLHLALRFYPGLLHPIQVMKKYRMNLLKPLLGR